jgi:hypothetical protein
LRLLPPPAAALLSIHDVPATLEEEAAAAAAAAAAATAAAAEEGVVVEESVWLWASRCGDRPAQHRRTWTERKRKAPSSTLAPCTCGRDLAKASP